ncbi:MAG: response regulator, partial [Candidatus Omnitrophica bacterium]|nr:response regulator [Candidatus Omnitrophota bacterium]
DVVITDYEMQGMDGLELIARIKNTGIPIKIILMSGAMDAALEARARAAGADGCLRKPFDLKELWEILNELGV